MTELEQARAHLRRCQFILARDRKSCGSTEVDKGILIASEWGVLAALSWVWDAQERDRMSRPYFENISFDPENQMLHLTYVEPPGWRREQRA